MKPAITTRVALLQALRDGPGYGKELIRRVERMAEGALRLSAARVYPCLHALEREGLASARRITPGRKRGARARTYYELTPLGVETSSAQWNVLRAFLGGPSSPSLRTSDSSRMAGRLLAAEELSRSLRLLSDRITTSRRYGSR